MSFWRLLLRLFASIFGVMVLLVGLLALRLAAGPMDVGFLTPYLEEAMTDAPVRLDIETTSMIWDGFGTPIELVAQGVTVFDASTETQLADIPALSVTLSVPKLFAGQIAPRSLTLIEPTIRVRRAVDGSLGLELAGFQLGRSDAAMQVADEEGGGPAEAASALGGLMAMLRSDNQILSEFNSLGIDNGLVIVDDRALGQIWTAPSTNIQLRRDPEGIAGSISLAADIGQIALALNFDGTLTDDGAGLSVTGRASFEFRQGGRRVNYDGTVVYRPDDSGSIELVGNLTGRWNAASPELRAEIIVDQTINPLRSVVRYSIDQVVPADWATVSPVLSPLSSLTSAVTATGVLDLDSQFLPQRIEMHMRAGSGQVNLPAYYDEPLNVAGIQLTAVADFPSRRFSLPHFTIDVGGPQINVSADIQIEPIGLLDAVGTVTLSDMPVDLLSRYWPETITPARQWITSQISRGVVRSATMNIHTRVFNQPEQPVELVSLNGEMALEDMTVEYLGGMHAVSGASGTAVFSEREFIISLDSGTVQGVDVLTAEIAITDLDRPPAQLDISLTLAGPVTNAMEVINAPRLRLADRAGLNPTLIGGEMSGRLAFSFPLVGPDDETIVAYGGVFGIRDGSATGIFDTLALTDLEGEVRVDGEGFSLTGTGALNGLPADILVAQSYEPDGDGNLRSEISTVLPDGRYDVLGFPAVPGLSGPLPVWIDVTLQQNAAFSLDAGIDLANARLEIEPLRFVKPPGVAGTGWVSARLQRGQVIGDVAFTVNAMGLAAQGRVELDDAGDVSLLDVASLNYERTDVSLQVAFGPFGAASIDIEGRQLDISRLIGETGLSDLGLERGANGDPPRDISVEVDRLIIDGNAGVNNVVADYGSDAGSVTSLALTGVHDGGGTLAASLLPIAQGDAISIRSTNSGALLGLFSDSNRINGGTLALDLTIADGTTSGTLVVEDFQLREAPQLARIMAAEPVSTQVEPLEAESVTFDRLETQISLSGERLTVRDGRASGGQLGITFDGVADLSNDTIDFRGTFVPLYGLNSLLSGVPLIGDLLYGGLGGGVFAFTYRIAGPSDSPNVSVNPLSVLAPGILRRIFFESRPPAFSDGG